MKQVERAAKPKQKPPAHKKGLARASTAGIVEEGPRNTPCTSIAAASSSCARAAVMEEAVAQAAASASIKNAQKEHGDDHVRPMKGRHRRSDSDAT